MRIKAPPQGLVGRPTAAKENKEMGYTEGFGFALGGNLCAVAGILHGAAAAASAGAAAFAGLFVFDGGANDGGKHAHHCQQHKNGWEVHRFSL